MIERDANGLPIFEPDGYVLSAFMADRTSRVKIIQGPVGPISADTEFLTPTGWKAVHRYAEGDEVAEWEPETEAITFRKPRRFIVQDCETLLWFRNLNSLSMMVSDEHRCPVYGRRSGKFKVKLAYEIAARPSKQRVPINFSPGGAGLPMTDAEIRLAVAIKADGCLPKRGRQCVVTVRKERKKGRMRELLGAADVEFSEFPHSTRPTELTFAFQREGYVKGFGPEWWGASRRQLEIILAECLLWDGLANHEEERFSTSIKGDADFIQYAAHATGRRASISRYDDPRGPEWSPMYTVHITKLGSRKTPVYIRKDHTKIDRVPAPMGKKYCFETSTGFFVVRHNGCIFVTGNSGTSSACCLHIWQQAMEQPAQIDGKQRFRAYIFRETYAKIEETALKTWLDWFPPDKFGRFYETRPYLHEVRVGPMELNVTFMAMEDIRDAESYFKSLEPSLIWFNEGQFAQFAVIREASSRVSPPRYPAVKDGGCEWGGLIIDTNAPPSDHWIPIMRGDNPPPDWMGEDQRRALKKPASWAFYLQPPGLIEEFDRNGALIGYRPNPAAENLRYLHKPGVDPLGPQNFYMEKVGAQTKQWIDANVMNRSSVVVDGKPVYPLFRRDVHVSDKHLNPVEGMPVIVGVDSSGRNPAALMGQNLRGDWFIQREFIGRDVSMQEFAPQLKAYLAQQYPGYTFIFWGDPAGNQRGAASDTTPHEVMRSHNMIVRPAPDGQNRQSLRHESVNAVLLRRSATPGRNSALTVDPRCGTYITGMSGGYFMRRIRVSGERYAEEPEKNQYADVCEAGEYMMQGGGEGRSALRMGAEPAKVVNTIRPWNPFAKRRAGLKAPALTLRRW